MGKRPAIAIENSQWIDFDVRVEMKKCYLSCVENFTLANHWGCRKTEKLKE